MVCGFQLTVPVRSAHPFQHGAADAKHLADAHAGNDSIGKRQCHAHLGQRWRPWRLCSRVKGGARGGVRSGLHDTHSVLMSRSLCGHHSSLCELASCQHSTVRGTDPCCAASLITVPQGQVCKAPGSVACYLQRNCAEARLHLRRPPGLHSLL